MKRLILLIALLLITVGCATDNSTDAKTPEKVKVIDMTATFDKIYETLDEIVAESELVVMVEGVGEPEAIEYEYTTITVNTVNIQKVLYGDEDLEGTIIKIAQMGDFNLGYTDIIRVGNKYLLFLREAGTPVDEEAHYIVGAFQGKFDLNNQDELEFHYIFPEDEPTFHADFEGLTIDDVEEQINALE